MSPAPAPRPSFSSICLVVLLVATLATLACRSEVTATGGASLVWEAWDVIESSYVDAKSLDSEAVVGNAIMNMLTAADKPAYPFLTELEGVRGRAPRDVPEELTDVWKAWVLFQEKWPNVDPGLLEGAAIDGMLDSLEGQVAERLTNEGYQREQERLKGAYQGIGAYVVTRDGDVGLVPMRDSPAEKAGLKAEDVLLEVDGVPVVGKTDQEVVKQVRGPAGTRVTLLVERAEEEEPVELTVIRNDIYMVSVDRRILPGAVAYIYISEFLEHTPDQFLDALEELTRLDMLALILDLRNNPGGSVEAARDVASQFLSDGLFMYEIDREGNRVNWPVESGGIATEELPMIVMVNELTGSAAEALAGALQDTGRAKILGTKTFGRGSANEFRELSDGSAIYISVSHWYTPSGRLMQGAGVEPEIKVALTNEDRLLGRDSQLAEAYDYLDNMLPAFR